MEKLTDQQLLDAYFEAQDGLFGAHPYYDSDVMRGAEDNPILLAALRVVESAVVTNVLDQWGMMVESAKENLAESRQILADVKRMRR